MEERKWAWQGHDLAEKKAATQAKPKTGLISTKLVLVLIGLVVLWFVFASIVPAQNSQQPPAKVTVSFKAFAGEENVLDVTTMVPKGTNAFDAMQQVAEVEFQDFGAMGAMIESINGVKPGQNEFWGLYVNGEQSMAGISGITIEEDTAIEWKIESIESYTG